MSRRGPWFALLAVLWVGGLFSAAPARAFLVQQLDAERVELEDFAIDGRWTLVMIWSTECIPCEQQKPEIEAFYQHHADGSATVVGLVLDGIEKLDLVKQMIHEGPTTFPNLLVFTDVFAGQYLDEVGKPFRATPTYLLYKPDGQLAGAHVGPVSREQLDRIVAGG